MKELFRIQRVTELEAFDIITDRQPKGLFFTQSGNKIVGIDNKTGNAFTKDFDSIADCFEWLMGDRADD